MSSRHAEGTGPEDSLEGIGRADSLRAPIALRVSTPSSISGRCRGVMARALARDYSDGVDILVCLANRGRLRDLGRLVSLPHVFIPG